MLSIRLKSGAWPFTVGLDRWTATLTLACQAGWQFVLSSWWSLVWSSRVANPILRYPLRSGYAKHLAIPAQSSKTKFLFLSILINIYTQWWGFFDNISLFCYTVLSSGIIPLTLWLPTPRYRFASSKCQDCPQRDISSRFSCRKTANPEVSHQLYVKMAFDSIDQEKQLEVVYVWHST